MATISEPLFRRAWKQIRTWVIFTLRRPDRWARLINYMDYGRP